MADIFHINRANNKITLGTSDTEILLTPMTQSSILFAGANGLLSQDNTNLSWDDTDKVLNVGTWPNVPGDIVGAVLTGEGEAFFGNISVDENPIGRFRATSSINNAHVSFNTYWAGPILLTKSMDNSKGSAKIRFGNISGTSPGIILEYAPPTAGTVVFSTLLMLTNDFKAGFFEKVPETAIELTHASPYFTFHNSTETNANGGRLTRLNFKGEQSGGEETTLARIEVGHDGNANDEKGYLDFLINDGNDGDVPTRRLIIDSTNFKICSTNISNYVNISHDNTDAYFKTDDGSFIFITDEGTNTNSLLAVYGKGTGVGILGVYDEDNAEALLMFCSSGLGLIETSGLASGLLILQNNAHAGVGLFTTAAEGETQELFIRGHRTGDSSRALAIGTGVDAADTVSFDGLSNYLFHGNFILPKTSGIGIKVDTATPTFGFADLLGDQFSKNTGGTKPTLTTYNGAIDAWQFSDGDEAFLSYHIPHDYVPGTDIHLHIHWSQNNAGATGGTIDFKYFAIYAKGHNQASGSTFTSTPITATFSSIDINDGGSGLNQYQQHITEVTISAATATAALFDRDDLEPDGAIELTFEMDANNLTGTPSDPFIHFVDIHYQTTGIIGTKSRTPDFYT